MHLSREALGVPFADSIGRAPWNQRATEGLKAGKLEKSRKTAPKLAVRQGFELD
jgi:hypothetical protein